MTINYDSDLCPDYFNREPIARNMANMLVEQSTSLISPAILCGSWGSGKSTHALRIKAHLEQQHAETVQCIYLDAFKCDHSDEPYGMILAALYDVAPEAEKKSLVEAIKKGTLPYLKSFGIASLKAALKYVVPLGGEILVEGMENATLSPDLIEEELNNIQQTNARIQALQDIIVKISAAKQIIFIVDELDRCRPDFAVDLLEKIKHIFYCDDIKFLLVMNKEQLLESIKHRYGINDNMCKVYLDKFIRHEFTMSVIHNSHTDMNHRSVPFEYFHKLIEKNEIQNLVQNSRYINEVILDLLDVKNMQLREVERWVKNISLLAVRAKQRYPNNFKGESSNDKSYINKATSLVFSAFINAFCPKTRDAILNSEYSDSFWRDDLGLRDKISTHGIPQVCASALRSLPYPNRTNKNAVYISKSLSPERGNFASEDEWADADTLSDIYSYLCYLNCAPYNT